MHIFFARYKMTGRAWLRLLLLSIIFNVVVCALTMPYGIGLFFLPFAIPIGIFIAFLPAMVTVLVAALFSRLRGHFSFPQFFVIGTLVSCAMAWRGIALENDLVLDHIFFLMRTLPLTWLGGWVVANVLDVLPEPIEEGPQPWMMPGTLATGLISLALVILPTISLTQAATEAIEARELAREAERRGDCPDDLQCVTYVSGGDAPDPAV